MEIPNSYNMQQQFIAEETIDIKKYIFKFLANWYWFIIASLIGIAIAFLVNRYSTPRYKTDASVMVLEKGDGLSGIESIIQEFGAYKKAQRKNVENQIGILQSYSLTYETVKELNFEISYWGQGRINEREIYTSCPFIVVLDTTHLNSINKRVNVSIISETQYRLEIQYDNEKNVNKKMFFGETYSDEYFKFRLEKSDKFSENSINSNFFFIINDYYTLAKAYNKNLAVEAIFEKGTVLQLTKSGSVSQKEVDFLNTLIKIFIKKDIEEKNISAQRTIEFIDEQLNNIVDSLRVAERNLEKFRLNNRIIDLSKEGTAVFEQLEEEQARKTVLDVRMKYYEYLLNYIKEKEDFQDIITPSVIGIEDNLLNTLVAQISDLYSEKRVIEYSAKGDNPSLAIINLKIKNTINALIENVNNIIQGADIEMKEVNKKITELDKEIQKLPVTERELINIQRKFDLNDNIYNFLLEKRTEAGITKASNVPDIKIIDNAIIQNIEPLSPKRLINYLIGLFIGFFLPALIIILNDFFNDKIVERKDIENNTTIPIIGSITHNIQDTDLVIKTYPKSSISEAFRSLRTNLQYYFLKGKEKAVITISSTISGEGKSFCALNLASILAVSNKKVLLIGLDLRKPKLHKELKLKNDYGMSTYLIGKSTYENIIRDTGIDDNLKVILSGPMPPNPAELIETQRMHDLIEEAQKEFDYVIIDTPPVALVADALLLMKYADTNIFVIRQNYSNKTVLKFVNDLKDEKNLDKLAILINDVDFSSSYGYRYGGYGRYGRYGYRSKYGYGYGQKYGYGYYEDDTDNISNNSILSRIPFIKKKK